MKKIRTAIIVENLSIPAWSYEMIRTVLAQGSAEIVLLIKIGSAHTGGATGSHLIYNAFRKVENKAYKVQPDPFALKDILSLGITAGILEATAPENSSILFSKDDIETIIGYDLDVLINLGSRVLHGDILQAAKFGVWSYYHGDNKLNRGSIPGFREVMENTRDTGAVLQILTEDICNGTVLKRSWSTTDRTSVNRNLTKYIWNSVSFLPEKLDELYRDGEDAFRERVEAENSDPLFYSRKFYQKPRNWETFLLLLKHGRKLLASKLGKLFYFNQIILLYAFRRDGAMERSIYKYTKWYPPKDRFWADPFIVLKDGTYYLFLEELIYKENNGRAHLAVSIMDEQGKFGTPRVILKKPYHLSYPNVFEYQGDYYMIPESMDNNTIELYKAVHFPYDWEFVMNLKENIRAVDTTILHRDGVYWMFVNIRRVAGASECDELFIFYADELLTNNWKAHTKNPVVSDVKSSRPAGNFFIYNDKLYRPSQDCSWRYGHGTVINEVTRLDKDVYIEKKVSSIDPEWDPQTIGVHTLNSAGGLTFIDAIIRRRKYF